jgi:membrane protease subunit HflC
MGRLKLIVAGVIFLICGIVVLDSMFILHQTQTALVMQFGKPVLPIRTEPGLQWKVPIFQDVELFDKRILDLDPRPEEILLLDQKRISVDSYMRYKIIDPLEFKRRALNQINFVQIFGGRLNAAVRAEVANVLLGDMLSDKRNDVMERITAALKLQAGQFGIEVVDVRIGRTDLPAATAQSVYRRMNSEREAQALKLRSQGAEIKAKVQATAERKRTVILAEARRTSQILRGEGEGKKTTILNNAFGQDPEFFGFYRSMEAYGEALGGEGTTMVLSPDSEFFRYFLDQRGTGKRK